MDSLVAPCAQRDRKRCVAQFKDRCARTVAEEHTGGAVDLVHEAGQCSQPTTRAYRPPSVAIRPRATAVP